MPRKLAKPKTALGKFLRKNNITVQQMVRDLDLSYRTGHMAYHGYRVSEETAELIFDYTDGKVPIDSMTNARPRSEFTPTGT